MTRELREHIASWPTWQRDLWLSSLVFCVVGPAWISLPPAARWWLVVCIVAALVVGLAAWGLEAHRGADLLAAENARLTSELAARGPRLRVVPDQRTEDDYWLDLYDEKGGHRA